MSQEKPKKEAAERSVTQALVIFEAIRKEGGHQMERPSSSVVWSGLATGLSMGFSLSPHLQEILLAEWILLQQSIMLKSHLNTP